MSGKAKNAPADPAAELRELVREAHAATRDARAAVRDLARERAAVEKAMNDMLGTTAEQVNKHIHAEVLEVINSVHETGRRIGEEHAVLLGFEDSQQLLVKMCELMADQIKEGVEIMVAQMLPQIIGYDLRPVIRAEIAKVMGGGMVVSQ